MDNQRNLILAIALSFLLLVGLTSAVDYFYPQPETITEEVTEGETAAPAVAGGTAEIAEGDLVRLEAGCDKRTETCRLKFNNFLNFQGFPHVPGEDWLMGYPSENQPLDGGSLFK